MPPALFNPTPEATAQILERFTCTHSSLANIAADYGTTLQAFIAWMATPEIQDQMRLSESMAWARTRLTCAHRMDLATDALCDMLAGYSYTERKVPMHATLEHLECRERQRSNARRAAHLLSRLNRAFPANPPSPRDTARGAEARRDGEASAPGHTPVRRIASPLPTFDQALALGEACRNAGYGGTALQSSGLQTATPPNQNTNGHTNGHLNGILPIDPPSAPSAPSALIPSPPTTTSAPPRTPGSLSVSSVPSVVNLDSASAPSASSALTLPTPTILALATDDHKLMLDLAARRLADQDHEGFNRNPLGASPPHRLPKKPDPYANFPRTEVSHLRSDISDLPFMRRHFDGTPRHVPPNLPSAPPPPSSPPQARPFPPHAQPLRPPRPRRPPCQIPIAPKGPAPPRIRDRARVRHPRLQPNWTRARPSPSRPRSA